MNLIFEEIITSFIENGVGKTSFFLPTNLALELKNNLINLRKDQKMISAGIGRHEGYHLDDDYRKDKICWLEKSSHCIHEISFFKLMEDFIHYLNKTCFAGIQTFEFHYAFYDQGSFYKKHLDQFQGNDSRIYSIIIYLNENWSEGDGGELVLYHKSNTQILAPKMGTMIFFDSSILPHEVLETKIQRMSITGWLKK